MRFVCLLIVLFACSLTVQSQDEHYTNELIKDEFPQFFKHLSMSIASDFNHRTRVRIQGGEFYYDNFAAGYKFELMNDEYDGAAYMLGFFARDHALNGPVRIFGQLGIDLVLADDRRVNNMGELENILDFFVEYCFELGALHPIDIAGNKLSFELSCRYHSPFGQPEPLVRGVLPAIAISYAY